MKAAAANIAAARNRLKDPKVLQSLSLLILRACSFSLNMYAACCQTKEEELSLVFKRLVAEVADLKQVRSITALGLALTQPFALTQDSS